MIGSIIIEVLLLLKIIKIEIEVMMMKEVIIKRDIARRNAKIAIKRSSMYLLIMSALREIVHLHQIGINLSTPHAKN